MGQHLARAWAVTAAVLLLTAWLLARTPASAQPAKQLTWADGTDITTMDGGFVVDVVTNTLIDLVYQKVMKYRPDMSIEPELAESWSSAPDKVTWTFRLKRGHKFSNGNPVNAAAVKFSIDRIMDTRTAAPNRSVFAAVDHVDSVDDATLRIVTKSPAPDLLQALADRAAVIVDPAEVRKHANPQDYGRRPVGSGPYMVAEWEPAVKLVLRRNPQFTGAKPPLDTIVYRPVPEAATRMAMLKSGEADIVTKPVIEDLEALRRDSRFTVLTESGYNFITYEMLSDKPPLRDVRVRWAINHAVDKRAIAEKLMSRMVTPACSTVTPGVGKDFYFPQPCYDYNVERARTLLRQAGYADGFDMEIASSNGRYLKDREMSETIAAYLNAVGIRAKVQFFEWATYLRKWSEPNRQMWLIGRSAGFTDFIFTRLFARSEWDSGANNNTRFYDPRVEEALVKARSTFDVKERARLYREIQEITWKFAPALYLHTQNIVITHRANVGGLQVQPNEVLVLGRVDKR